MTMNSLFEIQANVFCRLSCQINFGINLILHFIMPRVRVITQWGVQLQEKCGLSFYLEPQNICVNIYIVQNSRKRK